MQPFPVARRHTVTLLLLQLLVVMATSTSQGARCTPRWHEAVNAVLKVIADISKTGNPMNCTLYTPDVPVVDSCKKTAVACFSAELNVAMSEFRILKQKWSLKRILQGIENSMVDTGACAQCESYQERPVEVFLDNLKNFLQHMHSHEVCGR
ncbi:interleukin 15, like [Acipenser oxyrinchus oxyrinchus]|uniref:Interleukin n=1 Tax=Acipenser oxyrinchus oxyrinchus TaxID=40147 RepID=A0AAD8FQW9_ACIOX|nr:interleukin 15, like [Acipenser oxyrinchus oxyrinchus]